MNGAKMATSNAVVLDDQRAEQDRLQLQKLVAELLPVMDALQWPEATRIVAQGPKSDSRLMRWGYRNKKNWAENSTTRMAWIVTLPSSVDDLFGNPTVVGITTEGKTVESWMSMILGGVFPYDRLGRPETYQDRRAVKELIRLVSELLAKYSNAQ